MCSKRSFIFAIFIITVSVANVFSKNPQERKGKFFAGISTQTVYKTHTITSIEPSSCVQIEPTLPPCRNVRSFHSFPQLVGRTLWGNGQQDLTKDITAPQDKQRTLPQTELTWGEYIGVVRRTVTVVQPIIQTRTMRDPNVVVTFAVKGCRPSVLPRNLDACPSITIEEILPTSTVPMVIHPTTIPSHHVTHGKPHRPGYHDEDLQENFNGPLVEATEEDLANAGVAVETEQLQPLELQPVTEV